MDPLAVKISIAVICWSVMINSSSSANQITSRSSSSINCTEFADNCNQCMAHDGHCVFWFCRDQQMHWDGQGVCEGPSQRGPSGACSGKWRRLEKPDTCDQINTTTTTTTTTSTTTTTTTPAPTPTTSTPTTSSTSSPSTSTPVITTTTSSSTSPSPQQDDQKLTAWTIAGIVISSVVVILILVGVSYKKVKKLYQARNPYRHL